MSDAPRDQQPDDRAAGSDEPLWAAGDRTSDPAGNRADEPVTGPPAGAAGPESGPGRRPPPGGARGDSRSRPAGARAAGPGGKTQRGGLFGWLRAGLGRNGTPGASGGPPPGPEEDVRQRRRRRWFLVGISAGAALIVIALCAGTVALVSAVTGFRDRAADAREDRRLRDGDCLDLEQRLNRLIPPGATTTAPARAVAVRDENAAVRIYVNEIREERFQDGWRQLLDARTAYAEALAMQAKSRTPAFYVAPRAPDGQAVSDQLIRWSPAPCAGPIRRLSAPDL